MEKPAASVSLKAEAALIRNEISLQDSSQELSLSPAAYPSKEASKSFERSHIYNIIN
jgi:hypothetical protein